MPMRRLLAETPIVKPAETIPEKTFDHYWLANMTVEAKQPNRPVTITANMFPARDVDDGEGNITKELDRTNRKQVIINDVFGIIANDPTGKVAVALNAVMEALVEQVEGLQ